MFEALTNIWILVFRERILTDCPPSSFVLAPLLFRLPWNSLLNITQQSTWTVHSLTCNQCKVCIYQYNQLCKILYLNHYSETYSKISSFWQHMVTCQMWLLQAAREAILTRKVTSITAAQVPSVTNHVLCYNYCTVLYCNIILICQW